MKKLIVMTCLLACASAWGQVCKYKDASGSIVYSDGPCPKESTILKVPPKDTRSKEEIAAIRESSRLALDKYRADREQRVTDEENARQQRVAAKQAAMDVADRQKLEDDIVIKLERKRKQDLIAAEQRGRNSVPPKGY